MRVESDLSGALEGPPSNASEMEVMRPHLIDDVAGSFDPPPAAAPLASPAGSRLVWGMLIAGVVLIVISGVGLVAGGMGAAVLAFLL